MSTEIVVFVLAAGVGELLPFPKPRGRDLPISVAVIATYALLGHSWPEVVAVAAGGWLLAATVRASQGRRLRTTDLLVACVSALALVGAVGVGSHVAIAEMSAGITLGELSAVWAVVLLGLPWIEAGESALRRHTKVTSTYQAVIRENARGGVALAASAALGATVYDVFGLWSIPLVLLPLLAARVGLARYSQVRVTYDQTVRAMSRLPEELGTVGRGHGVRVGELAVAVARELGLLDHEVGQVERAAHLHELGQIQADLGQPLSDRTMALAGASILEEAGSLEDVAELVARHRDPYRKPGLGDNGDVALGARIIRTVCEFDRGAVEGRGDHSAWRALEQLHEGSAYDHDPRVLTALTSVLERQGRLGLADVGSISSV